MMVYCVVVAVFCFVGFSADDVIALRPSKRHQMTYLPRGIFSTRETKLLVVGEFFCEFEVFQW